MKCVTVWVLISPDFCSVSLLLVRSHSHCGHVAGNTGCSVGVRFPKEGRSSVAPLPSELRDFLMFRFGRHATSVLSSVSVLSLLCFGVGQK